MDHLHLSPINNGDYYAIPATYYSEQFTSDPIPGANMYVKTSKAVYAVQALAGDLSEATSDLNFIAPVNCLLSNGVNSIPAIANIAGYTMTLAGITIIASSTISAYTWYRVGEVVPGVTSNSYTPTRAGNYSVTVYTGGCAFTSATQTVYDCNPEIIVKTTADKNGILPGEAVVFKVSVQFLSDVDVNDLILTNLVPSNVTVTGASATYGTVTNSGSTYTWNIGAMRNGEEHILFINATGKTVASPTVGTLTVSKTQTFPMGTEANKVPDDFEETVTVFNAVAAEPTSHPTGFYFTNTGSAHPYNNVIHFTPSPSAVGYMVIRQKITQPGFVPVDGNSYTVGAVSGGEIIYIGADTSITDLMASHSTNYYYTIYPYNGGGLATNYLTASPLMGVVNNRVGQDLAMTQTTISSSAGVVGQGVNVTFLNGVPVGGHTLTATKVVGTFPVNYLQGLPVGMDSVEHLYFQVTSSIATPGAYVISLDFSALAKSEADWNKVTLLKRSNTSSNWENISSYIVSRNTDGLYGKFLVMGLSSFSEYAIGTIETVLPVTWVDFSAKQQLAGVLLEWSLSSEQQTRDFIIQHSINGVNWSNLASLPAAGNSTGITRYSYEHKDATAGATNYYRITQRDLDGKSTLSTTRMVQLLKKAPSVVLMGNPVTNGVLQLNVLKSGTAMLKSMDGRTLYSGKLTAGRQQINVQHFAGGSYLLVFDNEVIKFLIK